MLEQDGDVAEDQQQVRVHVEGGQQYVEDDDGQGVQGPGEHIGICCKWCLLQMVCAAGCVCCRWCLQQVLPAAGTQALGAGELGSVQGISASMHL